MADPPAAGNEALRKRVFMSIYLKENAEAPLRLLPLDKPACLTPGETDQARAMLLSDLPQNRTWDHHVSRAGFAGL